LCRHVPHAFVRTCAAEVAPESVSLFAHGYFHPFSQAAR
jgi:esterase/lipase superfamily enzyme